MLPAAIQVCPIELPGRGRRQAEQAISNVATLADLLVDSLPLQVNQLRSTCIIPRNSSRKASHTFATAQLL